MRKQGCSFLRRFPARGVNNEYTQQARRHLTLVPQHRYICTIHDTYMYRNNKRCQVHQLAVDIN